jgi:excisionase family DNA binding protein
MCCVVSADCEGKETVMQTFTVPEIAAILRVPKLHVYRLIREGKLPAVRVGRWVRVTEEALRTWMAQGGTSVRQARSEREENPSVIPA